MTTKLQAACIATAVGIPMLLTSAANVADVLGGEVRHGTVFAPTPKPRPRRLWWLSDASVAQGALTVDTGAARALVEEHRSLLAAGVSAVSGVFHAGDPVDVVTASGEVIATGLVGFASEELPAMLGRRSSELAAVLGEGYEREVIHRDQMVWRKGRGNR
jgi:glutamate 5-kinase